MDDIEIEYVDDDSEDLHTSQRAILSFIRDHQRIRPKTLSRLVGLHPATTRRHTKKLKDDGHIEKVDGHWVIADGSTHAAEKSNQISRLTHVLHEIGRLKREARRILEALGKEII